MRCEVCWMTCVFFSRKRLRPSFSSIVSETVLHPRFQPCSPDSSRSPVHLNRPPSRLPSEPYRDAFAASDADVNET